MKKKLLMTVAIFLISLAGVSFAEYAVTTADGNGADGGVSNDENQQDTVVLGASATVAIRHYDGTRAKAAIVRFDLGSGIGGDISGATFSITEVSSTRNRTVNIYGLKDESLDFWDEAILSYNTAPGLTNPENDGYLTMDPNVWELNPIGTFNLVDNIDGSVGDPIVLTGLVDPNFIASDTNGAVTFLLYTADTDSNNSAYVAMKENTDGHPYPTLTFPNARFATDPDPANGSTVLDTWSTLGWTNTDANDLNPASITCDVYFGTEPNRLGNMDMVSTGAGISSLVINTTNFPNFGNLSAGTYYWAVDSYDSSSTPSFLGEGAMWSFDVTSAPVITGHPVDQITILGDDANDDAAFSASVTSTSNVTCDWYRSDDNANDTPGDDGDPVYTEAISAGVDQVSTLTLTNVTGSDEGYYYCKAVNSSGEAQAAYSDTARLVVQRQVAHWTLDELVSNQFEDTSGEGHHADPNNLNVTFVNGVNVATTNQGAEMDPNSAATAGTWDPSYVSGEFTLSLWMKWDGTGSGGFRDLLTKHNGWNAATTLWQFGLNNGDQLALIRAGGTNVYGQDLTSLADEWIYVAVTYDGITAKIYSFVVGSSDVNFNVGEDAYSLGQMPDANFGIGCFYDESGVPVEIFPGIMDEIQVFNYAKDAIAIADLYNEAVAQDFCLSAYEVQADANGNCRIDMADFATVIAADWLDCGLYPNCP